jgi:hypothetical protein
MKWLLQNFRRRVIFGLKNPRYTMKTLLGELTLADERFLSRLTGARVSQIRGFLDEPISFSDFSRHLREAEDEFRRLPLLSGDLYAKKVLSQYALVRAVQPELVVETGIANGISSAYLLLAIRKNGRGRLHSVGFSEKEYLPPGRDLGWFVPGNLRGAWSMQIGDCRKVLPPLLSELGRIGLFIHDSLHTYEHMLWEFRTAYPYLSRGGWLVADDALWNSAFTDFASEQRAECRIIRGVGFLRKNNP